MISIIFFVSENTSKILKRLIIYVSLLSDSLLDPIECKISAFSKFPRTALFVCLVGKIDQEMKPIRLRKACNKSDFTFVDIHHGQIFKWRVNALGLYIPPSFPMKWVLINRLAKSCSLKIHDPPPSPILSFGIMLSIVIFPLRKGFPPPPSPPSQRRYYSYMYILIYKVLYSRKKTA